jgi:hypothetical protein
VRVKISIMTLLARFIIASTLALSLPLPSAAQGADPAQQISTVGGSAGETLGADPAGSGPVVECVTLAAALNGNPAQTSLNMGTAAVPQNPLAPFQCWPRGDQSIP